MTSLVPVEPATENKRKSPLTVDEQQPSTLSPKWPRVNEQYNPWSPIGQPSEDNNDQNNVKSCNGHSIEIPQENISGTVCSPDTNLLKEKDILGKCLDDTASSDVQNVPITLDTGVQEPLQSCTTEQVLFSQDDKLKESPCYISTVGLNGDGSLSDGGSFLNDSTPLKTETRGSPKSVLPAEDASLADVFWSETVERSSTETSNEALVPVPTEIFWRNKENLCWLDSLLVALVNLKSLRTLKPKDNPGQFPIWTLLMGHNEACADIQRQQQTDTDGCLKVPNHVLHKINRDLDTQRMSVFNILQPKLHCKLGQNETPVFALPLLGKMDSWLEPLFLSTFEWEFKCTKCKSSTKQNVVNMLPTFTNIVPDWHPLRAVHLAPCNNCHRKNQRRKMVLLGVPPVFALHFVQGLPDNNIQAYSFSFNKKHYSVSAVIQYSSQYKHFVTWIHQSDGSWVEFDDLKHPHCKTYKTLPIPAQEIHIVFWEEEERRRESRACSPSTTFTESPQPTNVTHSETDLDILGEDLLQCSPNQLLHNPQNGTDVMDGTSEQDDTETGVDTSIASTMLLDVFEGLMNNDVTITLVDVSDSKNPTDDDTEHGDEHLKDVMDKVKEETPAPDSSTLEAKENPKETDTDTELSPVSDPEDNLSDDPTFEPKSKKRKKGTAGAAAAKRAKTKKFDNPKEQVASNVAKNTLSCPIKTKSTTSTTTAISKPSSSVSPTASTLQNVSKNVPQDPPMVQQQEKGWSHLLERSLGHIQNTTSKFISTQKAVIQKPIDFIHSTPTQQTTVVPTKAVPKPGLRKEEKGGLPLKAAEMYGAFGSKNSKNSMLNVNMPSPVHKPLSCNTILNNSINGSTVERTPDITSIRKSKLSKLPPGLSETEVLRYKLMKKLKAKKKKLAKLNEMLGQRGDAKFIPDSTNMSSPNTVTSSTLDEEFFSDLLSPATTITSTLSPDSTDFLEMLANGQERTIAEEMPSNTLVQQCAMAETADLLDEFMSQAVAERQTEMEAEALSALDLFL